MQVYTEMRTAATVGSQLTEKIQAIIFIPWDHISQGRGAAPVSDHPGDPRANLRPRLGHAQLPAEHPTALKAQSLWAPKPVPRFV